MNLKMKVLVVDDEELIRNIIVEYCHNEGYLTDEACDGLEAIEKVKNNDYDIIILDLMMPKLDGYTSYRQIKDIKNIPTIVLSARSEEADKLLGFDLGVDDYMVTSSRITDASILENVSYFKLNSLMLSYNFDGMKWLHKAHINTLGVSLSMTNLFTITNYSGIDPETPGAVYPTPRTFSIGLSVGF